MGCDLRAEATGKAKAEGFTCSDTDRSKGKREP